MLAEKMRLKLLSGSNNQASAANDEEMGSKEEMQDWLLSVGIASPVTKESAGALYHQQLSRQESMTMELWGMGRGGAVGGLAELQGTPRLLLMSVACLVHGEMQDVKRQAVGNGKDGGPSEMKLGPSRHGAVTIQKNEGPQSRGKKWPADDACPVWSFEPLASEDSQVPSFLLVDGFCCGFSVFAG
ncbi:hypothetical protein Acr_07g0008990 [Actinidia rufa]|uniref:Vacuolar protein-sorting-associated protein 36 n=1 Tax=Actinidia rufa TaxID=165716 RepID=A0A7J0EWF6_9ERIC|nr:hypothetical protein Acr_07g0008990 [Actinidia rufa]